MCKWNEQRICLVPIHAEDSHTGKMRWAYKGIDLCLADQVNALNAVGRFTRGSCCGHGKGGAGIQLHDGTVVLPNGEEIKNAGNLGCINK